jgi:lipoprotein-anchoring transpeptidase ErfK/SrfK
MEMRSRTALAAILLTTLAAAAPATTGPTQALVAVDVTAADSSALTRAAAPAIAPAPAPAEAAPPAFEADLDPGEFVWQPERSPTGAVEIVVSIPRQVAYVYRGGELIGVTTVSTGRRGHSTPTGSFPILQKRREHYSNLYNNAPMPFMQRLTWDGIALHAGHIPGRPASHGCVRLPLEFARLLFSATSVGTTVHILDSAPAAQVALAVARGDPIRGRLAIAAMADSGGVAALD